MVYDLKEIARIVNGKIIGNEKEPISGAAPFELAGPGDITYAGQAKFIKGLEKTNAGAVMVPNGDYDTSKNLILVENPQIAFITLLNLFYPPKRSEPGISPLSCIGKNFISGSDPSIHPFVVIGDDVVLGDRVTCYPGSVIGDHVRIGDDVTIHANVVIMERCIIGDRVIIHAGTVIGSDGFGFAPDGKRYRKIPHFGIVRIDDDVEIGAGNTIDRATFGKTWIQRGVKTDNLVHIAHNVTIGEDTVVVAQVGIAGSTKIGKNAILAGQAGIAGHLEIGDHVTIGPQAGIARSIPAGTTVSGSPEMPHALWLRVQGLLPKLPEFKKEIRELDKRLTAIEGKNGIHT
ncbi:MAG: UDP-3-O-(3-hydroxymyristoyl)glucosamine N-acyltransferase [Thermodesulfobacteriota bacterium]